MEREKLMTASQRGWTGNLKDSLEKLTTHKKKKITNNYFTSLFYNKSILFSWFMSIIIINKKKKKMECHPNPSPQMLVFPKAR